MAVDPSSLVVGDRIYLRRLQPVRGSRILAEVIDTYTVRRLHIHDGAVTGLTLTTAAGIEVQMGSLGLRQAARFHPRPKMRPYEDPDEYQIRVDAAAEIAAMERAVVARRGRRPVAAVGGAL